MMIIRVRESRDDLQYLDVYLTEVLRVLFLSCSLPRKLDTLFSMHYNKTNHQPLYCVAHTTLPRPLRAPYKPDVVAALKAFQIPRR